MAHEEIVYELMRKLVIACKHIIGDLMAHKGLWTKGVSTVNNSYKALNLLVDSGKLVKGDGYFKLPECQGHWKEHSQLLTKALAEILKLNYQTQISREKKLNSVSLIPDAIVYLKKNDQHLCFILEICLNEKPEYLLQKIHTWQSWPEAKDKLSELFNTQIKAYDFVVSGDDIPDEAFEFNAYMEELKK